MEGRKGKFGGKVNQTKRQEGSDPGRVKRHEKNDEKRKRNQVCFGLGIRGRRITKPRNVDARCRMGGGHDEGIELGGT